MRTRLMLLSTALLAGGAPASPAFAAPPLEPLPDMPPLTGLELCGTTVTISEEVQREKENLKTGRVTGALKVRITNEGTGESIVVNASGPGTFGLTEVVEGELIELTFSFKGRSLIFATNPDELEAFREMGLPDIFVTSGPFESTVLLDVSEADEFTEPTFVSTTIDTPRRIQDVCEILT